MPVFNIAANTQRLRTPWEQRAIRAASRVNEVNAALGEKRLETYDEDRQFGQEMEKRTAAREEANTVIDAQRVAIEREKLIADKQDALVGALDESMMAGQQRYQADIAAGVDEKQAGQNAKNTAAKILAARSPLDDEQAMQELESQWKESTWNPAFASAWVASRGKRTPTGKMIEAESIGLVPGTKEYADYLKGGTAPTLTPARVVAPILAKMAAGQEITEGEQAVLDYQTRMDPLTRLTNALIGDLATEEAPGLGEPELDKEQLMEIALANLSQVPQGPRRQDALDDFMAEINKRYPKLDISKEEVERFVYVNAPDTGLIEPE